MSDPDLNDKLIAKFIDMAEHCLSILEDYARAYTEDEVPVNLSITIEDKREEILELRKKLENYERMQG